MKSVTVVHGAARIATALNCSVARTTGNATRTHSTTSSRPGAVMYPIPIAKSTSVPSSSTVETFFRHIYVEITVSKMKSAFATIVAEVVLAAMDRVASGAGFASEL